MRASWKRSCCALSCPCLLCASVIQDMSRAARKRESCISRDGVWVRNAHLSGRHAVICICESTRSECFAILEKAFSSHRRLSRRPAAHAEPVPVLVLRRIPVVSQRCVEIVEYLSLFLLLRAFSLKYTKIQSWSRDAVDMSERIIWLRALENSFFFTF